MGSITINSNIASLNAQRRLGQSTQSLRDSFTRLSSGLRINKASDDAAGLSIAESLQTDQRVYNQGVRNLNDGVSLLSIADGALSELSNITIRLSELAEQAANGSLSNTQRGALDEEAQALKAEYFRISKTTEFNGQTLFDGEFGDLRLQAGYGEDGGIVSGLGGKIGTGNFETATNLTIGGFPLSVSSGDFNGDGFSDLASARTGNALDVRLGDGAGNFSAATSFALHTGASQITSGDFNGDGVLDLVTTDYANDAISVLIGDGAGNFSAPTSFAVGDSPDDTAAGDFNGDGILDLVAVNGSDDKVTVLIGDGSGSFSVTNSFAIGNQSRSVTSVDLDNDGILDLVSSAVGSNNVSVLLGDGTGGFGPKSDFAAGNNPFVVTTGDFNGDGVIDLATSDQVDDTVSVFIGDGTGDFAAATKFDVGVSPYSILTSDFNGDGALDLVTANSTDNNISVLLGNGTGSFAAAISFAATGNGTRAISAADFNGDGVVDLITANSGVSLFLGSSTGGVAPLLDFSLNTQADARQALPVFKQKLDQLASQRGQVGAFEARLSTAVATTRTASENYASAASQIVDADVAVEAAKLVRNQILQQAGAAILAQANQGPALALALLS